MKVVIEKCLSYSEAEVAIANGLEKLGGIEKFISKGDKVVIKANLLQARSPEEAITTHPDVVRAVVRQLKKLTDHVAILDSPGIAGNVQGWQKIVDKTGMKKISEEEGVSLVMGGNHREIEYKEGIIAKKFVLADEVFQFDKIVNIAKLKTHSLTVYTGAVKNMFGLIPGRIKSKMHVHYQTPESFSKMLLDLYNVKKADLNIIDGVEGMEGQGPSAGDKRHFGVIGLSQDALALDYVIAKGLNLDVPMIKIAKERNMIVDVEVVGEFKSDIKPPKASIIETLVWPVAGNIRRKLSSKPALAQDKCTRCASCFKICPVDAIKMLPYPSFDYSKCIRCYCCHEICPEKAIFLKKSFAQKVLGK